MSTSDNSLKNLAGLLDILIQIDLCNRGEKQVKNLYNLSVKEQK